MIMILMMMTLDDDVDDVDNDVDEHDDVGN